MDGALGFTGLGARFEQQAMAQSEFQISNSDFPVQHPLCQTSFTAFLIQISIGPGAAPCQAGHSEAPGTLPRHPRHS